MPIMLGRTTLRSRAELRAEYRQRFLNIRVKSICPGIDAIATSYAHPIFWAPFTLVGDGGGSVAGGR